MKNIFLLLLFFLLFQNLDKECEEKEEYKPPKIICDQFSLMEEHYTVISAFLLNYVPKEEFIYIEKISDDYKWIFEDKPNLIGRLKKFLEGCDSGSYLSLFQEIQRFKNRRCVFEKKFKLPYEYELVDFDFKSTLRIMELKTEQGIIKTEVFKHPVLSFSVPIFDKDQNAAFLSFSFSYGPSWGRIGWAILEKEFDYWRTIRIETVIVS